MKYDRFKVKGPGDTEGGWNEFIVGFSMLLYGAYSLLQATQVTSGHGAYGGYHGYGGLGAYLGPGSQGPLFGAFLLGIFLLFFNAKSPIGWVIMALSGVALGVSFIMSLSFRLPNLTGLSALWMFGLFAGGLGLTLASLRDHGLPSGQDERPGRESPTDER